MYGRRASGMRTLPSAWRLFSRNAISIRGGATTVLFSVWARYLPFSPFTRMRRRRACASPRLEQLPTSKYFFWRGDHASTSTALNLQICQVARAALQRAEPGYPCERKKSTVFFHSLSYHVSWSLPACRQRSFPAFQTGEYGKRRVLRCRAHLLPYGSTGNSSSASAEARSSINNLYR